jgi:hypothetical protein
MNNDQWAGLAIVFAIWLLLCLGAHAIQAAQKNKEDKLREE